MPAERRQVPTNPSRTQRIVAATLRGTLQRLLKPMFHPRVPPTALRAGMRLLTSTTLRAPGIRFLPLQLDQVKGEAVLPAHEDQRAVLYLHGGAYCVGSPATHRAITSHLAQATSSVVYAIDYRLAPEHRYPAACEDALTAYQWLLDNGYRSEDIHLAGDSAGGGLALATAIQIRDRGLPAPGSLLLLSPWADLTLSQRDNYNPHGEAMLTWETLEHSAALYAGDQAGDALASPLFAPLDNLPPTLVIVGTDEILLGDAEALHQRLAEAGVPTRLSIYEGMWHVFPAHAGMLATANAAIEEMAAWMATTAR